MGRWMISLAASATLFVSALPALAGFDNWSVISDDDPFSGGSRVTIGYSSSIRSGALIMCDTAKSGITIRAIPGFVYDAKLSGFEPSMEFAIDGKRLKEEQGRTGAVGDNLAISEADLPREDANEFVEAFSTAKRQVAIKDGISDRPHLLGARGSKKAGAALARCLEKQSP